MILIGITRRNHPRTRACRQAVTAPFQKYGRPIIVRSIDALCKHGATRPLSKSRGSTSWDRDNEEIYLVIFLTKQKGKKKKKKNYVAHSPQKKDNPPNTTTDGITPITAMALLAGVVHIEARHILDDDDGLCYPVGVVLEMSQCEMSKKSVGVETSTYCCRLVAFYNLS